jgi:hypothetical protein
VPWLWLALLSSLLAHLTIVWRGLVVLTVPAATAAVTAGFAVAEPAVVARAGVCTAEKITAAAVIAIEIREMVDMGSPFAAAYRVDSKNVCGPIVARRGSPVACCGGNGKLAVIQLIDYGWVRHIHVLPSLESTMIPIARAAQNRLGKPQFNINGHYEQN